MSDLIERLRAWEPLVSSGYECPAAGQAMSEAAEALAAKDAEIARLNAECNRRVYQSVYNQVMENEQAASEARAEIARLREALDDIANHTSCHKVSIGTGDWGVCGKSYEARQALGASHDA